MAVEEKQAANRMARLREEIEEHNRRYYEEAAPTISDREYDRLYAELVELESRFPEQAAPGSPTRRVGGRPLKAFTQVTHRAPMLSLDNTYSQEEVADFYDRLTRLLPGAKIPVVVEPKVDGVAVSLLYENGKLRYAAAPTSKSARVNCAGSNSIAVPNGAAVTESIPIWPPRMSSVAKPPSWRR